MMKILSNAVPKIFYFENNKRLKHHGIEPIRFVKPEKVPIFVINNPYMEVKTDSVNEKDNQPG